MLTYAAMRIAIIPSEANQHDLMLKISHAGMQPEAGISGECAGYIVVGDVSDKTAMDVIKKEAKLGKPILGIGQGVQCLLETGLLPGIENDRVGITLKGTGSRLEARRDDTPVEELKIGELPYDNICSTEVSSRHSTEVSSRRAFSRDPVPVVFFRLSDFYQLNTFTHYLKPKDVLSISDEKIEKTFVIPPALLAEMQLLGMNVFHYCDQNGKITDQIAAISNKAGNIMAMLPHVEKSPNSDPIFQSMRDYIRSGYVQRVLPLNYYPR